LGREFSYELLRAVSSASDEDLRADLDRLAEAELIYARGAPPDARYRFKHALTQDAAYEALLKSKRRELHAKVARTLTERFGDLEDAQPEVLARHWTQAGESGPAIAAWKQAGDAAYARRAFKEAEEGYRQALAILAQEPETQARDLRELEVCSALNRVLQLTSGYAAPETVEMATRARSLAEKSGSIAQQIREEARIWRAIVTAGDYAGAAALGEHILALASSEDEHPARLVFVHNAQVQTRFYTGDLAGVEEHFARFTLAMEASGMRQAPGNNVIGIGVASLTAWAMGRGALAQDRMDQALTLAQASTNPYDLAMALHFQSLLHSCERDAARTEETASQLLEVAEQHGFSYASDLARSTLGWARALNGGRGAHGVDLMREAWGGLAKTGARVGLTYGLTLMAEIQGLNGQTEDALEIIDDALTANPQERVFRAEALRLRGHLRLQAGDPTLAEADFREAAAFAEAMGAKSWSLRATTSLCGLCRQRGEVETAQALLSAALTQFDDGSAGSDLTAARSMLNELGA
jgi:tetratricopeptide (TPR) repeat protein